METKSLRITEEINTIIKSGSTTLKLTYGTGYDWDNIFNQIQESNVTDLTIDLGTKVSYLELLKNVCVLTKLTTLSLTLSKMYDSKDDFMESLVKYLPKALSQLENLRYLSLKLCGLFDDKNLAIFAKTALPAMSHIFTLDLDLSENYFTDEGLKNFAESFEFLIKLTKMNLDFARSGNIRAGITDKGLEFLSTAISKLANLTSLEMNFFNQEYIPDNGDYYPIGNNSITDKGFIFLCNSLKDNKNLETLQLFFGSGGGDCAHEITDKSFQYLASVIKDLSSLSCLYIAVSQYCKVTLEAKQILKESLKDRKMTKFGIYQFTYTGNRLFE